MKPARNVLAVASVSLWNWVLVIRGIRAGDQMADTFSWVSAKPLLNSYLEFLKIPINA